MYVRYSWDSTFSHDLNSVDFAQGAPRYFSSSDREHFLHEIEFFSATLEYNLETMKQKNEA